MRWGSRRRLFGDLRLPLRGDVDDGALELQVSSPSCCVFLRLRRQPGVEWMQGRWWRRCEATAAVGSGLLEADLWRRPWIWGGRCSGCCPDLWAFIVKVQLVGAGGSCGSLKPLWWQEALPLRGEGSRRLLSSSAPAVEVERAGAARGEDGEALRCRPSYPSFSLLVSDLVIVPLV